MTANPKLRSSIGLKFSLSVFIRAGMLAVLITLMLAFVEHSRTKQEFIDRINTLTASSIAPLRRAIYELDDDFAIKVAEGLLSHAEVGHVTLIDDVGPRQIYSRTADDAQTGLDSYLYSLEPVQVQIDIGAYGSTGTLLVKANVGYIQSVYLRELSYIILSEILMLLFILILVVDTFKKFIAIPLSSISKDAKRIEQGDRSVSITLPSHQDDELGMLSTAINKMAGELIDNAEQLEQRVKKRTEQLEESHRQLAEAEKMKALGTLVAGVAHEVNTPLGSAVTVHSVIDEAFKELLIRIESGQMTKSDLQRFLDTCEDALPMLDTNLQRAADLIRSFKQVAVDQSHDEQRELMLAEYVQTVLNSLHSQTKRNLNITLNCPMELRITSLPGVIAQLVTNLVINTLMHAYDEDQKGQVNIDIYEQGPNVIMIYQDYGKGIPEKDHRCIFDPFWTTKRGSGGSGLGLSILYNLTTQKLQGTIHVDSAEGQGAKFTLSFPKELHIPATSAVI